MENSKTVNQEPTAQQEKTFTQAELDQIISDRLSRTKAQYADYEELKQKAAQFDEAQEANKSELQKATERNAELQQRIDAMEKANSIRTIREKVASEMNVPASLLNAESEEDCKTQAEAILNFAKQGGAVKYPNVKDGGESKVPTMTKEEIYAIKDEKKRLKAIQDNIELF